MAIPCSQLLTVRVLAMVEPWVFVVLVLAVARVTRFVVFDSLMGSHLTSGTKWSQRLDLWAFKEDGTDNGWWRGKVGTLLVCPWCSSFWITLVCVCGFRHVWPWELHVDGCGVVLAVAMVASLIIVAEQKLFA